MNPTKIEWADMTWNPIRAIDEITDRAGHHCIKTSPGCDHCYAESMNRRFGNGLPYTAGAADRVRFELDERGVRKMLFYRGRKKLIFAGSMTDLFQAAIPFDMLDEVTAAIAVRSDLDFVFLTKRAKRMAEYVEYFAGLGAGPTWPYANLWIGVSVSTQAEADRKIPILLHTPAAHRLVSIEPMLEEIHLCSGFPDWLILGQETGPGARKPRQHWFHNLNTEVGVWGVPIFTKPPAATTPQHWTCWPKEIRCAKRDAADPRGKGK